MQLDEMTRRNLELVEPLGGRGEGETLLRVLDEALTPMGARLLRRWILAPLVELPAIHARQAAVAERSTQTAQDATAERVLAIVRAAADTQVQTDIDAHYRVENIKPGKYVVFAEWPSDEVFLFWAPIELEKGDEKKQDLDRATLATAKLRCQ